MAARKRIGLCYTYNENWIGGTYYIENLINALNTLDEADKPHIVLITNQHKDYLAAKNKLTYRWISYQVGSGEKNRFFQFINKVTGRLFKIRLFKQQLQKLDAIFPYYKCIQQSLAKKKIYWIADFQEHFAPEFFNGDTIAARQKSQLEIQSSLENLIVSSNDALEHFKKLYPNHTVKVSLLPFAVTHPDYRQLDIGELLKKYNLPGRYFICPNQFWKHKNQITVLKAVRDLKEKGINITVAFTGNTKDDRHPEYYNELRDYIDTHELHDQIIFLGFIDRAEQLQLMNNCIAIIQPSLFEGWSTVVEDAKSMNKFLIVSNIDIHKEQLENSSALFFEPLDESELAAALQGVFDRPNLPALFENNTYGKSIYEFGANFLKIATDGFQY
jgi:glycosyltransferase involved in cell wall biosynthesis